MESIVEEMTDKNTLYTNYRAEFVAACLKEGGFDSDEVRIIREGSSKGGKNIDKILLNNTSDRFSKYLNIYTRKRNLYESLPEDLFHRRMDVDDKKNKETLIDYIKQERQVASDASRFFRPFEMAIDRFQVEADRYEMRLEKRERHDDFIRLFVSICPLLQGLPLDKSLFVVSLLSQTYRLTRPEQIAEILSVFLDCNVEVFLSYQQLTLKNDLCDWTLGENRLSVSTALGGEVCDSFPVMNVRINSLPPQYKDLIFEESLAYKRFIEFMDLFVPADTEIIITINAAREGVEFVLVDDGDHTPLLGYSTILS